MPSRLKKTVLATFVAFSWAAVPSLASSSDPERVDAVVVGHSAVILLYHHVDDETPPSTSVARAQFEAHLDYLDKHGFTVWPLDSLLAALRRGATIPDPSVAITFDDAYRSVFETAWPRLKSRGWPCTVFVPTAGVDQGLSAYMTYDQMRTMQSGGASFGAHSHTHPFLVRRESGEGEREWKERVRGEIMTSRQRLRDELGDVSICFAYPYGEFSGALQEIVRELGLIGLGQHSGCAWQRGDFTAVPRFAMAQAYADLEGFATKVHSLALPVLSADPADPVRPLNAPRPTLRLHLAPGPYDPDRLACFVSGQGRAPIRWVNQGELILEVQAPAELPPGRSRFNLTAPHGVMDRYFWYSHLWIIGHTHDS